MIKSVGELIAERIKGGSMITTLIPLAKMDRQIVTTHTNQPASQPPWTYGQRKKGRLRNVCVSAPGWKKSFTSSIRSSLLFLTLLSKRG